MHFTTSFLAAIAPLFLLGTSSSAFQLRERGVAAAAPTGFTTSVLPARDLTATSPASANTDIPNVVNPAALEDDVDDDEEQVVTSFSRVKRQGKGRGGGRGGGRGKGKGKGKGRGKGKGKGKAKGKGNGGGAAAGDDAAGGGAPAANGTDTGAAAGAGAGSA